MVILFVRMLSTILDFKFAGCHFVHQDAFDLSVFNSESWYKFVGYRHVIDMTNTSELFSCDHPEITSVLMQALNKIIL